MTIQELRDLVERQRARMAAIPQIKGEEGETPRIKQEGEQRPKIKQEGIKREQAEEDEKLPAKRAKTSGRVLIDLGDGDKDEWKEMEMTDVKTSEPKKEAEVIDLSD